MAVQTAAQKKKAAALALKNKNAKIAADKLKAKQEETTDEVEGQEDLIDGSDETTDEVDPLEPGTEVDAEEEEAKKAADAKRKLARQEADKTRKVALKTLFNFKTTDLFKTLPADVMEAIERIAKAPSTRSGGGGSPTAVSVLSLMFPEVNSTITELKVFMQTKKGRNEFRQYILRALNNAAPEARMWIEVDTENELWTLVGIGETEPDNFTGPKLRKKADAEE